MASAVVDPRTTLKCRKCRYLLLEQPPHRILEDEDSAQEVASTFNICDDNLPQWIADAVEEVRHYNNITHNNTLFHHKNHRITELVGFEVINDRQSLIIVPLREAGPRANWFVQAAPPSWAGLTT